MYAGVAQLVEHQSLDSPAAHSGVLAADGGVLKVTGAYDVNLQFLMGANSSSVTDSADNYNNLHANGQILSGANGGFYYTPAPVPLPGTAWLMLSGIGGLGWVVRARKTA
jgi:PEP-CTERM motif